MTFYDFLAKFAWFRREIYFGRSVAHAFLLGAAKYGDPDRLRQYLTGKKVGDQGRYVPGSQGCAISKSGNEK